MRTLLILLLFIASGGTLFAQIDWDLTTHHSGVGPAAVFADQQDGTVHVLTTGTDADFDGVLEPEDGDVSAGWYVYDDKGTVRDSTLFGGFFNSYPVRVGVDYQGKILYAPVNGNVASYSLETLGELNTKLVEGPYATVSYDPLGGLLILGSRAPDFVSPGKVLYAVPQTGTIIGEVTAGINPGMGVANFNPLSGTYSLYTINEGTFGEPDASITYTSYNDDAYRAVNNGDLGGGAADLFIGQEDVYVLLGSTHQIRILGLANGVESNISPIDVGTEGFDSPRALVVDGSNLFVGTYASDIRRYSLADGSALGEPIPAPGKVEDVAMVDGILFAAIAYSTGTYDADSLVFVADGDTGVPIDTLVTGVQPVAVFADEEDDRVLLLGYGADGEKSWWSLLSTESLEVVAEGTFDFDLSFPLRAAYNAGTDELALVGSDVLYVMNVAESEPVPQQVFTDPEATGGLFGVSDGGKFWLVTERPNGFASAPCYVHMVRKSDGERVAKVLTDGDFILTAELDPASMEDLTKVFILHEGNFGGTDAVLGTASYAPEYLKGELGSGANHILYDLNGSEEPVVAVTMNGGHEIVMLDLNSNADGAPVIDSRFGTGTTGFDGPREAILAPELYFLFPDPMIVTTYSGEVLLTGSAGEIVAKIETGFKNEGIAILDERLYVANAYEKGTFTPGNSISTIVTFIINSVDDARAKGATQLAQNYPNPVQGWTSIPFSLDAAGPVAMDLYSLTGELVAELMNRDMEAGSHELLVNAGELTSGSYIYVLRVGDQTYTRSMEVVR